jgi:DNA-binding NtrC family response regulator
LRRADEPEFHGARPHPRRRVLIYEASPSLRSAAEEVLRRAGHDVEVATDEDTARRILSQRTPALGALVVGADAPDDAGVRVLFAARQDHPDLPIVAWTERSGLGAARHLVRIPRGWLPEELIAAIEAAAEEDP